MIFHLNFEAEKQKLRSGREDIGGGEGESEQQTSVLNQEIYKINSTLHRTASRAKFGPQSG